MNPIFHRPELATALAQRLLRPGPLDVALRSGLFVRGMRRTGKTTFVVHDLVPSLEALGALVVYVDLWRAPARSPATVVHDAVREAMWGQEYPNLTGGTAVMLPNHHLAKPVLIGEIRADGQFDIISQTDPVDGDAWTDYLPESAVLESDWAELQCGMFNTETGTCVQLTSNY